MLSTNKPLMDQKFNALYDSAFRQAAYNAHYAVSESIHAKQEISLKEQHGENFVKIYGESLDKDEKSWTEAANAFADEFVNQLKSAKLLETISDEIDGHIKSMKLVITMLPQGIATLISPVGPCSGSMIISDGTANINIL